MYTATEHWVDKEPPGVGGPAQTLNSQHVLFVLKVKKKERRQEHIPKV